MQIQKQHPVGVRFGAHGEVTSNGISFGDYSGMQTLTHKQSGARRYPAPTWALNDKLLQIVLCEYLLIRAFGTQITPRRSAAFQSTAMMRPLDKLRFAEKCLLDRIPNLEERLTRVCAEYVRLKHTGADPARLQKLESVIEGIDSTIICDRSAGKVVCAVVYFYHRAGLDSVGVAQRLSLRPPNVRQILHRLSRVAQTLGLEPKREWFVARDGVLRIPLSSRRAQWRADGLCSRCGGVRSDEAFKSCKTCRDKHSLANRLRAASQNPAIVEPALSGPSETTNP